MLLSLLLAFSPPPQAIRCTAIDGDTLHCRQPGQRTGYERVRLLGIDAPERPGTCQRNRRCAPGDYAASKASLADAIRFGPISIYRVGQDRYGRTLALVSAGGTDMSCWQLRQQQAVYRADWDTGRRLRSICPA